MGEKIPGKYFDRWVRVGHLFSHQKVSLSSKSLCQNSAFVLSDDNIRGQQLPTQTDMDTYVWHGGLGRLCRQGKGLQSVHRLLVNLPGSC